MPKSRKVVPLDVNQLISTNMLDTITDGWWIWNLETNERYLSPNCRLLLGLPPSKTAHFSHEWLKQVVPEDVPILKKAAKAHVESDEPYGVTVRYISDTHEMKWFLCRGQKTKFENSNKLFILGTYTDVTPLKKQTLKLKHQALTDALTQLPNRLHFEKTIENTFSIARQSHEKFTLFFMDLDGFKEINDSLGHTIGDSVLQEAAQKFSKVLRQGDFLARTGGDEFVLIAKSATTISQAKRIATSIAQEFLKSFTVDEYDFLPTVSIGCAIYPTHATTKNQIIHYADIALYEAKEQNGNSFVSFNKKLQRVTKRKEHIAKYIPHALTYGELFLSYQPIVTLSSGDITGFQVLPRWFSEKTGYVEPDEFDQAVIDAKLVEKVWKWTFQSLNREMIKWQRQLSKIGFATDIIFSVHMPDSLLTKRNISELILFFDELELMPEKIILDFNYKAIINHSNRITQPLKQLHDRGFLLGASNMTLEEFSIEKLEDLPVQYLRVKADEVDESTFTARRKKGINTSLELAEDLDFEIIVDSVDTKTLYDKLKNITCDLCQGQYIGARMQSKYIVNFLKNQVNSG